MREPRRSRWRAGLTNLAVVAGLLTAVSYLPPDTSLSERKKAGTLPVCLAPSAPPLVTESGEAPGYDTEVLTEIARRLGLRLVVNPSPAIGKDFNPRNWHITRARCVVIAGGITDTPQTRGFLQVIPTGLRSGWAVLSAENYAVVTGSKVAVLPGSGGLSRVALSGHLRQLGIEARMVPSAEALRQALASGQIEAGLAEVFAAEAIAAQMNSLGGSITVTRFAQEALGAPHMAIGLWKGDLTLKRAVVSELASMAADGTLDRIGRRYGVVPHLN